MSYKGEQDKKKILDVNGFHLLVPSIEYHDVTWTWLDLLLNVKSRVKRSLVEDAIKHVRLQIIMNDDASDRNMNPFFWLLSENGHEKSHHDSF